MVVNKKGGNKAKKQKKHPVNNDERKLVLKDEMNFQEYAQINKLWGNGRFEANCFDGKIRLAHARGNLKKKKIFVKTGDVVIISLREFEDAKCDVIYVYKLKEIKELKKLGEIPQTITEEVEEEEKDIGVDFNGDDEEGDEEEKKEEFKIDSEDSFNAI